MKKKIGEFFIWCSAADKEILTECPTEKTKYQSIGATIFLTALIACVTGGYAVNFTFDNIFISIPIALFWGFFVFNLDRAIVVTLKKSGVFKKEIVNAIPRFVLAVILALCISKPFELKLFEKRITVAMDKNNQSYVDNFETGYKNEMNSLTAELGKLGNSLIQTKQEIFNKDPIHKNLIDTKSSLENRKSEIENTIKTNDALIAKNTFFVDKLDEYGTFLYKIRKLKPPGVTAEKDNKILKSDLSGVVTEQAENKEQIKVKEKDLADQVAVAEKEGQNSKDAIIKQFNSRKESYATDKGRNIENASQNTDLLARLEALGSIKTFWSTAWFASILVTWLFIFIECAPVLVKLLSKRGPYDEILERKEYEIAIEQKKIISTLNNDINTLMQEIKKLSAVKVTFNVNTNQVKLDAELQANKELLEQITKKQGLLAQIAIDKWFNEEEAKLKNDHHYNFVTANGGNHNVPPLS